MAVTAGYSVDASGFNKGVNCATGYTYVWLEDSEVDGSAGFCLGCIRGLKTVDAYSVNSSGFSRGEDAPFAVGQSIRYPEMLCGSGRIRKLSPQMA